jgi:hypothetical protein
MSSYPIDKFCTLFIAPDIRRVAYEHAGFSDGTHGGILRLNNAMPSMSP